MELINIFLGNFLVLLLVYLVGSFLLFPHYYLVKGSNPYVILFHKLFFGVIGIITVFSIYYTRFSSINLIFCLVYFSFTVFQIYKKRINWKLSRDFFSDINKLPYFFPVFIIAVCVGLFKHHFFLSGNYYIGSDDFIYYLQLARFLPVTGHESLMPWNILISNSNDNLLMPYHYGDLWLISFCINSCPFLLPMVTYNFVVIPVLVIFVAAGLTCLIHSLIPRPVKIFNFPNLNQDKLTEFIFPFIGFLFAMYWGYTPRLPLGFIHTISIESKMFNFVFPFTFSIFCFLQGKKKLSVIAFASIFILDFIYFPVISASFGIVFLFFLFKKDMYNLKYFLFPLVAGAYVLLFYFLNESLFTVNLVKQDADFFSPDYFRGSFLVIFNYLLRHLATCFPFYIALFLIVKNRNKFDEKPRYVFIFIAIIIFSCFLLAGFGHVHKEFWQLARPLNPSTFLFLLLFFVLSFNRIDLVSKKLYVILFLIVTLQGFLAVVSQSTQSAIPKEGTSYSVLSKDLVKDASGFLSGDKIIAFFANEKNHSIGVTYNEYNFSGFLNQDIWFVEVNLPDEVVKSTGARSVINLKISPFFKYMQALKENNLFVDVDDARLKFLKEKNINYVFNSGGKLPDSLKETISDSVVLDSNKSLTLYKLDFNRNQ